MTPHLLSLGLGGCREEVKLGAQMVESFENKRKHLLLQLGKREGGGEQLPTRGSPWLLPLCRVTDFHRQLEST
jgi:hypothetical protein